MILRTYRCPECWTEITLELTMEQWNDPPPFCPSCSQTTQQELKAPVIGGSSRARATAMAEEIAAKDYGVADMQSQGPGNGPPKVRYQGDPAGASTWGAQGAALQQAIALGRENRLRYGSGLDALQSALRDGTQPDLIELSKKRSSRIW